MQLGIHLRELWDHKVGLAISLLLAVLAASRLLGVGLFPPRVDTGSLNLASASTRVLVDTRRSAVIDLRQDTYGYAGLTNRALLLGNVMASAPVRDYIGRRAGVPAWKIRISAPLTPEQPRAIADSAHRPKSSDILKSPDEYRLSIVANPTVPVLDVYSEAPDAQAAAGLANGAVAGLRDYLGVIARENGTPPSDRVRLDQLGRATGSVIDHGAGLKLAILVFVLVFAASCAAVLFISRVRSGWDAADGLAPSPDRGLR